ncbi:MAG: ABC transporter permease [Candidatus Latescibacteria bacterium]|nr:ABC transporter permease [Candidatus Latescibacterota bacterium]
MTGALYPLLKASRVSVVDALKQRGMVLEFVLSRRLYALLILGFLALTPAGFVAVGALFEVAWRPAFSLVFSAVFLIALLLVIVFLTPSSLTALVRLGTWPICRLFRFEGFLIQRALSRSTDRIAASLITLAVVFAAVVGLKHMTMSLKVQSQEWVEEALTDRIFVGSRLLTPEEYGAFGTVNGVREVVPMSHNTSIPFLIRGIPADALRYGPLSGSPELMRKFRRPRTLMMSSQLSFTLGLASGDSVSLPSAQGNQNYEIMMVTDDYGYFLDDRSYAVMSLENMMTFTRIDTSSARQFTLVLDPGSNQARIKNDLYATAGQYGLYITTGDEKSRFTLRGIDQDFVIFELILAITALLAGIGVTNALLIGALERKREFGLLQALGVTPEQLRSMMIMEGTVIGIVGGVLGALLGIPMSLLIIDGLVLLSSLNLTFVTSPLWIGISIVASISIATISAVYPALRSVRMSIAESIQYE